MPAEPVPDVRESAIQILLYGYDRNTTSIGHLAYRRLGRLLDERQRTYRAAESAYREFQRVQALHPSRAQEASALLVRSTELVESVKRLDREIETVGV